MPALARPFRSLFVLLVLLVFSPAIAGAATPSVEAGFHSSIALRDDGMVLQYGEAADGSSTGYMQPGPAPGPGGVGTMTGIRAVAAGGSAMYALHDDGTVFAWGVSDYAGQLGDGVPGDGADGYPDRVVGADGTGTLSNVVAIAGGQTHALAALADGTVWAWGRNDAGCLGNPGAGANSAVPVQVVGPGGTGFLTGIVAVSGGAFFSIALASDGTVWGWGDNYYGQLGNGAGGFEPGGVEMSETPLRVLAPTGTAPLSQISLVQAGQSHVIARRADGTAWAWGDGQKGQLGNGVNAEDPGFPETRRSRPVQVLGPGGAGVLSGVVSVAGHSRHSVALLTDGSVWTWGDGTSGQLGQGNLLSSDNPLRMKGAGGTGFLTDAEAIAAGGGNHGHTVVLMANGTVRGVGSNFYFETGAPTPGDDFQAPQLTPVTACGLRLKAPYAFTLDCPTSSVIAGEPYVVSWSGLGAGTFRLEIDGTEQLTTDQSIRLTESDSLASTIFRTFRVRPDDGCGESAWSTPCRVTIVPACTEPPSSAPALSCPARASAGVPFQLTFTAVTGANEAKRYQLDADGDGQSDAETQGKTDLFFERTESGYGPHALRVRAVNPCGEGPWSEPCVVNVRPDVSHCFTVGAIDVCASALVEEPPGTFTATSDYIRLGDSSQEFGLVVDGSVSGTPATSELSFAGRLFLDTELGGIDILSYDGSDGFLPPGDELRAHAGGAPQAVDPSVAVPSAIDPVIRPATHFPRFDLPTGMAAWTPPTDAPGLFRLLTGIPCSRPNLFPPGFSVGCLPFNGQVTLSLQLFSSCVSGNATFGIDDVPENPGFQAGASFQLCPTPPYVSGIVADVLELRLAGCELRALAGTLTDRPVDSGNMGIHLDTATLRCPQVGGLSSQLDDVFVTTGDLTFATGAIDVPNLDLILLSLEDAHGDILRRDPEELGYRICGTGDLGVLGNMLGVEFGFTLLDGTVQKACANPTALKRVTRFLPHWPVWIDRIGGCYTADASSLQPGEACATSDAFEITTPCVTCDLGDTFQLHASAHAGSPVPWFGGDLVSISPGEVTFGDGFSMGGTVKLLGKRVGTGQICVTSSSAEICTEIDLGGVITGSAALGVNDRGLGGHADVTIDIPKFDVFCPACVGIDAPPVSAGVFLGEFEDDVPFVGKKTHYGVTTGVSVGPWNGRVGLDVRYLSPHFIGVRNLGTFAGAQSLPAPPPGVNATGHYVVLAGETQVVFGASSPAGLPVLALTTPGGETIDASSDPDRMMQDAEKGSTVFVLQDPEPGAWTLTVTGLPDGAEVALVGMGDAVPATVAVTEPAVASTDRRIEWTAALPVQAAPTTLSLYASQDPVAASEAAGQLLHQAALVAGPGFFDVPEGVLPAGTWHVAAILDDGIGHVSATPAAGSIVVIDALGPEPPDTITLSPLPDGVRVAWTASSSPDVGRYEVLVSDEAEPGSGVVLLAGRDLVRDVLGLSGPGLRRFLVRAVDISGNVGETRDAGTAEPDAEADGTGPGAPEGLVVEAVGTTGLLARWSPDADAARFRVYYGITADLAGRQATEGESPVGSDTTALALNGFVAGQRIFVAVSGFDAAGNEGPASGLVSVLLSDRRSADGDALPDDWESLFFASLAETDGTGDSDGDALSDAEELALGRDPLVFDAYAWGDLAPASAPNGVVDIGDVVRALRLAVGLEEPSPDDLRRGDVAPAVTTDGLTRPTALAPRRITIADVVLMLRAAVGLTTFADPETPG